MGNGTRGLPAVAQYLNQLRHCTYASRNGGCGSSAFDVSKVVILNYYFPTITDQKIQIGKRLF
jgi:hypothetical protein